MNFQNKKIGIWGFGVVGKAALNYFKAYDIATTIMDTKEPSSQEYELINKSKSTFIPQSHCNEFLKTNDFILASPGIDLRPFSSYRNKFISELDLFFHHNKKPIIAITGTIGKTSVTHILSTIMQKHTTVATGGNIGTGMLELLPYQNQITTTILELSSFQLENCQFFAPDLAILTNFYPNHLDRHTTLEEYFNAKYAILANQQKHQQALVPLELASKIVHKNSHTSYKGILQFFSAQKPCLHQLDWLPKNSNLFWLEENEIVHFKNHRTKKLLSLNTSSETTFATNWLIITAALYLLDIPLSLISLNNIPLPEHRVEKIAMHNNIEFYNDSKATIMESTLAAVDKLQGRPLILFLGGLSKGVDRSAAIARLYNKIKHLICFGSEAKILHQTAQKYTIPSSCFTSLEDAVTFSLTNAQPGDQILFSPGGSSYDLFKDYKDRGEQFKKLVQQGCKKNVTNSSTLDFFT